MLSFSITTNVGYGFEVFVVGNHPDVGNWDPAKGAKLIWTTGNVWTGMVGIQSGTALDYKYVVMHNSATGFCNPAMARWIPPGSGNHSTTNAPAQPAAPYSGKTLYYHSNWTNVSVLYSVDGLNFMDAPMQRVGAGRSAGEYLYRASGFGEAGEAIQFVLHGSLNGVEGWDNAPYSGYGTGAGDYYTLLDVIFLQDGGIFNYNPPSSLSAPRIIVSNAVSTFSPSPSRTMKVYLPRGYVQNIWKRYPVIYMHDGENVFSPGGTYGSWDADLIATKEISQGRMREAIIVTLNSTANRTQEYLPPEDNYEGQGFGDAYANFLIYNVKTKIDSEFRTLTNRDNTAVVGSSMGGIISTFLGWSTNTFGLVGAFSPAYLTSPNFNAKVAADPKQPIRIYCDMGTIDLEAELLPDYWTVFGYHLMDGYELNRDLLGVIACGQTHNEAAWASRLPRAFSFLLDLRDEPNQLAHQSYPAYFKGATVSPGGVVSGAVDTLAGRSYVIEAATSISNAAAWSVVSTVAVETLPWSNRPFAVTNGGAFYRAVAR